MNETAVCYGKSLESKTFTECFLHIIHNEYKTNSKLHLGGRQTMRGTLGREPHMPYQISNIPYQIWNSMGGVKKNTSFYPDFWIGGGGWSNVNKRGGGGGGQTF